MRREEVRKSVFKKDEERLQSYLKQQKMHVLEQQVKMKDKQIEKLTKLVKDKNGIAVNMDINPAVLAMSPEADDEKDEEAFYDRGTKINKAEWLMAQVDLDPIESHGSMEMSTTKFKSIGGKRFINSDRGPIEDSQTSNVTKAPTEIKNEKTKEKKSSKGGKSYESQFIDVSEDKMRNFVMDQLKRFDVRMEYDNEIFNED